MALIVYGIKNCNTVKSALSWLNERKIAYAFHDFKTAGVTDAKLKQWCAQTDWTTLVNKRGTTWRQLAPAVQEKVTSRSAAIALMKEKPTVIKRPVIESGDKIATVGFDADLFQKKFEK